MQGLRLNVTDLDASLAYWRDLVGMNMLTELSAGPMTKSAALSFGADQAALELRQLPAGAALAHEEAYGRVAFACPSAELRPAEAAVREAGRAVLTPFVSLDTPVGMCNRL